MGDIDPISVWRSWFSAGTAVAGTVGALTANLGYIATLVATSNACVRFHGMGATVLPYNIGVNAYVGAIGVAK